MRRLLARSPLTSSAVLAALVLGVAAHQFWLSATGPLSAWKGGGFGMYTTPHINARAVWLHLPGGQAIRLHPPTAATLDWIDSSAPAGAAHLAALLHAAEVMRTNPTAENASALLRQAAVVKWPAGLDPALGLGWPAAGQDSQRHDLTALSLSVTELARRPFAGQFGQSVIFTLSGGDVR